MSLESINIRFAEKNDCGLLLDFIRQLALYEKRADTVIATEENIIDILFKKKIGQAIIAEIDKRAVGFAIFLYNFSTFEGKCGIYVEDMFVSPDVRNKGIGKKMFSFIARHALSEGCGRIEWTVLKWNEPSINFYKKLGAEPKDEWDIYKLSGNALERLAWK